MPVVKVHRYFRVDAQANPDVLYLFGDNNLRAGYGGQAAEMRGEPNAVGVRTKWAPTMERRAFFSDREYDRCIAMIHEDLEAAREHLGKDGIVVIPLDGLGSGFSKLPEKAPRVNEFLLDQLQELEDL